MKEIGQKAVVRKKQRDLRGKEETGDLFAPLISSVLLSACATSEYFVPFLCAVFMPAAVFRCYSGAVKVVAAVH